MQRILLIEDNQELAALLLNHLAREGFEAEHVTDGALGLQQAQTGTFDLVICDIVLPELDGLTLCTRLRETHPEQAILMLTSKAEELDKVTGLELGADDYVTKPFQLAELIARVRALLRRANRSLPGTRKVAGEFRAALQFAELKIDRDRRKVFLAEQELELTQREFELLEFFAEHPGRPFDRNQLVEEVWGNELGIYPHSINSMISRIRKKIEQNPKNPRFLLTVHGFGYRFCEQSEIE